MENYYYENRRDGTFAERASSWASRRPERPGRLLDGPAVADLDGTATWTS